MTVRHLIAFILASCCVTGCSEDEATTPGLEGSTTGGAAGAGGVGGGSGASSGTGGASSSNGGSTSGGTSATGGFPDGNGGSTSGGSSAAGGTQNGTGGSTNGGASATGGVPNASGGTTSGGAGGTTSGGASATGGAGGYDYWPNPDAPTNSHAWIRDHHDEIRVMRPRVLVLDVQRVGQPVATVVQRVIDAVAEGSRYHAYSDSSAPVFLEYQIDKTVDLRDPTAEYPSFWPPGPNFDVGELFTTSFASRYGYEHPDQPGSYLTMCELFERGIIHELWIAAEAGVRAVYENQSRMQRYDSSLDKIPGSFQECTNGCYNDPQNRVNCSVSVRMQELNKGRGPGCFTHAAGHALENMRDAIPYVRDNGNRFFYFGMRQRYGLPYDRLYDIDCFLGQPAAQRKCSFPSPTTLSYAATSGESFTFDNFGQGCGDVHHKPNIYGTGVLAAQACEHYGMKDGPNGSDLTTLYSQSGSLADTKMTEYERQFPDCDGGWQTYMRQSMPGYRNAASDETGAPMKNWWPFLYY